MERNEYGETLDGELDRFKAGYVVMLEALREIKRSLASMEIAATSPSATYTQRNARVVYRQSLKRLEDLTHGAIKSVEDAMP